MHTLGPGGLGAIDRPRRRHPRRIWGPEMTVWPLGSIVEDSTLRVEFVGEGIQRLWRMRYCRSHRPRLPGLWFVTPLYALAALGHSSSPNFQNRGDSRAWRGDTFDMFGIAIPRWIVEPPSAISHARSGCGLGITVLVFLHTQQRMNGENRRKEMMK